MYYILAATLVLLIFVLFIKALGTVLRGILTTVFVLVMIASLYIMFRSIQEPVDLFGIYQVDRFEVKRFGD